MSPLLLPTQGVGKSILMPIIDGLKLNYYGPGQCGINLRRIKLLNTVCGFKNGLLCPFGFRFTEKFHFSTEKNDLALYGQYHEFWPTGIGFDLIKHFVQLYRGSLAAAAVDSTNTYMKKFDYGPQENLER